MVYCKTFMKLNNVKLTISMISGTYELAQVSHNRKLQTIKQRTKTMANISNMDYIIITKAKDCYMAAIYDNGKLVIQAPTPYTLSADINEVATELSKRNTGHKVFKSQQDVLNHI